MKKLIVNGGKKLKGEIAISGSKNVALKVLVAACLTDEEVTIRNVPLIGDVNTMIDLVGWIGGKVKVKGNTITVRVEKIRNTIIPLEIGAKTRASSMFLAPLLCRAKRAKIPNPGGCRIGARPIDRHIEGLRKMGASIVYDSKDGFFHAKTSDLHACTYKFEKNTHTGTETMILASVRAKGKTVIENAALEPEIDDLISFLNSMGGKIRRVGKTIIIEGVEKLHGTSYSIMFDRNETMTFAIASALTGGGLYLSNIDLSKLTSFLDIYRKAGGKWEEENDFIRFYMSSRLLPTDVVTKPHPGFMTDWQGPWALFMTQAEGDSTIHESVYENRFGYVSELRKMGANIDYFDPKIKNADEFYNFNFNPKDNSYHHAIRVHGRTRLHNAVLQISDLRAGATILLAALIAKGQSVLYGVEQLERGYENMEGRLKRVGADIRVKDEN